MKTIGQKLLFFFVVSTHGVGQVNIALSEMDKVPQNNAASSEETAGIAAELTRQINVLKSSIEKMSVHIGLDIKKI